MQNNKVADPNTNYKRPLLVGLVLLAILVGGVSAWANYNEIAGAVVASGSIEVRGKPKSVQHIEGGVVKAINVAVGDQVSKDDIVIELDGNLIEANMRILENRLGDALVRQARLYAELETSEVFEAPTSQAADLKLGELDEFIEQQNALLKARFESRATQLLQLEEREAQYVSQIDGFEGILEARQEQLKLYREEREDLQQLVAKQLTSKTRLQDITRAEASLLGDIAETESQLASTQKSIAEVKVSRIQVDREFHERVVTEIDEVSSTINELKQQLIATRLQFERLDVRAPVSGYIHELSVFTIGGVVQAGEILMQIIPEQRELHVEVTVPAVSIDQIKHKQEARLRFPAFHQRTTPELNGYVTSVSPTSVIDENTGLTFYRVNIDMSDEERARLGEKSLVPGMPVEALIKTDDRTVLSYFTKPLTDYLQGALRER